jgi:uncharacterized protein (TIGR03083 family)
VNTTTATDWIDIDQLAPLGDAEIWRLARTEYVRMLALLRSVDDADWSKQTDCAAWTVRDLLGHLVGAAEGFSNPLQFLHQYRVGARFIAQGRTDGKQPVDGANAVQVAERSHLSVEQLLGRYEAVIEPTLRWRRRLRHLPVRLQDVAGAFTFRELFQIILTRDTWIHRIDISRAIGKPIEMTADHDGRFTADMVRDWASRFQSPFLLRLTGVAGGAYRRREGGEMLELTAVEFARLLSGRGKGDGLLSSRIVF